MCLTFRVNEYQKVIVLHLESFHVEVSPLSSAFANRLTTIRINISLYFCLSMSVHQVFGRATPVNENIFTNGTAVRVIDTKHPDSNVQLLKIVPSHFSQLEARLSIECDFDEVSETRK